MSDDPMREFARSLFAKGTDPTSDDQEPPSRSNVVPREGQTRTASSADSRMREFARNLFHNA